MNILENENFSDNSEESDLDSSRLENLHWCSGFECGDCFDYEGKRM